MELPKAWIEHDSRIKPYRRMNRYLAWSRRLVSLALMIMLFSGYGQQLGGWVSTQFESDLVKWFVYFLVIGAVFELIGIPFGAMAHAIERRFELSRQPYGRWFWDRVKGWMVGLVLGAVMFCLLYGAQQWGGSLWWLLAASFMFVFSIVLAQLGPVLLIPIFFKLHPLAEGPLKKRLLDMCRDFKIDVKDVYHLGMGDKTEKGNAAFTGLGRTKRILIGDTLYERFLPEQVEAVFAHELGHQVHGDIWRGLMLSTAFLFLSFWLTNFISEGWVFEVLETSHDRAYGLFAFFVVFSFVQMPLGWVQAYHSRLREWAADSFAAQTVGVPGPLGDALEKLTIQNWGLFKPNAIVEFFTYSHPAPWRRITTLRSKGENK